MRVAPAARRANPTFGRFRRIHRSVAVASGSLIRMVTVSRCFRLACISGACVVLAAAATAHAQPIGVELHNTMLPVAGGMGGASIAQPQEVLAAINANPAALSRFDGTQFQFGGGWTEATYNLAQTGSLR